MDEEDIKVTQYLIPANVTTRFEFFEGFGWYELKIVTIALLLGTLIFFILGIPKKTIQVQNSFSAFQATTSTQNMETKRVSIIPTFPRSFCIILPGISAFFIVKREPSSGMSLITLLKSSKEFKKKQKRYLYKYNSGSEVR